MTIHLRTEIRVYCDGGTHQGLEFTTSAEEPMPKARQYIRSAGWTIKRDGRTLCPMHARQS